MADQFPSSRILGNDLSPVQPTWIPGNCTFEVDDFNKPWVHQPSSFDFIFARDIYGSVSNWSRFLSEAFTALTPGGYYESVEMKVGCKSALFPEQHDEIPGTWAVKRWYLRGYEAARKTGRELDIAGNMEKWMRDAGFVDVEEKVLKIPVGAWDQSRRRIGKMMQRSLVDSAEGFCLALFTRYLGLAKEETLAIVGAAKEQLMDDSLKIYVEM